MILLASKALTGRVLEWLLTCHNGQSSRLMAGAIVYGPAFYRRQVDPGIPGDYDDVRSCVALYHACKPNKAAMTRVRRISPEWDNLVDKWQEVVDLAGSDIRTHAKHQRYFSMTRLAPHSHRRLVKGEIIEAGDEFLTKHRGWILAALVGKPAPDPVVQPYRRTT